MIDSLSVLQIGLKSFTIHSEFQKQKTKDSEGNYNIGPNGECKRSHQVQTLWKLKKRHEVV